MLYYGEVAYECRFSNPGKSDSWLTVDHHLRHGSRYTAAVPRGTDVAAGVGRGDASELQTEGGVVTCLAVLGMTVISYNYIYVLFSK